VLWLAAASAAYGRRAAASGVDLIDQATNRISAGIATTISDSEGGTTAEAIGTG
jgi:hypothetical protein